MGGHGSGFTREKRLVNSQLGRNKSRDAIISQTALPAGDSFVIPNLSGVEHELKEGGTSLGTAGSVLFLNSTGNINEDNTNFFWDDTNNRLGLGINAPLDKLHIKGGDIRIDQPGGLTRSIGFDFEAEGLFSNLEMDASAVLRLKNARTAGTGDISIESSVIEASRIRLLTNNTEILTVAWNGKVGIGVTAPDAKLDIAGTIMLKEQAEADADIEGKGQIWVNTATPNELFFTDDAGTDFRLGTGGESTTVTDTASIDLTLTGSAIKGDVLPAGVDHDALNNFAANEHIDWTNASNNFKTTGTMEVDNSAVFNESGADKDFRIEGDTEINLLFVDASTDRVGFGSAAPDGRLEIETETDEGTEALTIDQNDADQAFIDFQGTEDNTDPPSAGNITTLGSGTDSLSDTVAGPLAHEVGMTSGWTHDRMIRIEIDGTEHWIPAYKWVEEMI